LDIIEIVDSKRNFNMIDNSQLKKVVYFRVMKKRFNSTGVCVSRKHYMVDISDKLKQIKKLIDNEFYNMP